MKKYFILLIIGLLFLAPRQVNAVSIQGTQILGVTLEVSGSSDPALLLESGSYLLLENGSKLLLE